MELDNINQRLYQDYSGNTPKTLKDKMKEVKRSDGSAKYPELQDDYVDSMLAHYGIEAKEDTKRVVDALMPIASNVNVRAESLLDGSR